MLERSARHRRRRGCARPQARNHRPDCHPPSACLRSSSRKVRLRRQPDSFRHVVRRIGKAVFEIARYRQTCRRHDLFGMGKRLLAADAAHIRPAEREGKTGELVVASALAPLAAIILADPMSHGLGMTKQPLLVKRMKSVVAFGKPGHPRSLSLFGSYIGCQGSLGRKPARRRFRFHSARQEHRLRSRLRRAHSPDRWRRRGNGRNCPR